MKLTFVWRPAAPRGVVASARCSSRSALGLVGTLLALGQKPATVLRNL